MRRQAPDAEEVSRMVAYFLERLNAAKDFVDRPDEFDFEKGHDFYARREIQSVTAPEALLEWSYRWCGDEDWRRARDSLRSQRYMRRNAISRISVTGHTKEILEERAKQYDMAVWKYLRHVGLSKQLMEEIEDRAGMNRGSSND